MKIIVANWKMNLNVPESYAYFVRLSEAIEPGPDVEVVLCPTYLALQTLNMQNIPGRFKLGAQNCNAEDKGAQTGEVSAAMLVGVADYVIVGHSERRKLFGETDYQINRKVLAALRHGLKPILCIGEDKNEDIDETLRCQIDSGLLCVRPEQIGQIIIAYEPVYAIGSGRTSSMNDIAKAVGIIKSQINYMFGSDAETKITYGGSVDETNTAEILSIPGVDGLLVGGASLNVVKFAKIVEIAREL